MTQTPQPWYRRTVRWGQTNITELDPQRYDINWWRAYWRRTQVQGVIINAGGIVAYYPSQYPLHYRARFLDDRDLFGELCEAARAEGLVVLARMDSNRTTEDFYNAHPGWFARDREGNPYRAGDRFITCIFSDYYNEYLPDVLREIAERYRPDGFTDNSWSGLARNQICYCDNCAAAFRAATGHGLPTEADWTSPVYRAWIRWNYDRRLAVWDLNNRTTQAAGGPDCLWLGMSSGNLHHQSLRFRDLKAICERSPILMLDHQRRSAETGFQENSHAGKLLHGLMGWDKLIPESMAQYQAGTPTFRVASKPVAETHLWMVEGFAGGIQPWWHFIGAYHEDRRQYRTPERLMRWHAENEAYLLNREPVATVGVVWSQENLDFYGQEHGHTRVMQPYFGIIQALVRARIPYLPVHADHITRDASRLTTLVLPHLAAMSDSQMEAVRAFVAAGGNLVVTGETSRYTGWGDPRPDFGLADLLGVHATGEHVGTEETAPSTWEAYSSHSYLRLHPELRGQVDGPKTGGEPLPQGERHPVLQGFEETDILPFGGRMEVVQADTDRETLLTFVPPFPIYPPETAWMQTATTGQPALVLNRATEGGRVAYLAADLDRCFARYRLPDHGDLLANLVRWADGDACPLAVEGSGLLDCHLYRQPGRLILHLVNLTAAGYVPVDQLVETGPYRVRLRLPDGTDQVTVQALVRDEPLETAVMDGWVWCMVPAICDHEVLVVEGKL